MNHWDDFWRTVTFAVLAAVGGLMGYTMRTLDAGQKLTIGRAVIEAVASGFVGVVVMFLCRAIGLGEAWSGVVVGVFGWLGANASFALLERTIRAKIGLGGDER